MVTWCTLGCGRSRCAVRAPFGRCSVIGKDRTGRDGTGQDRQDRMCLHDSRSRQTSWVTLCPLYIWYHGIMTLWNNGVWWCVGVVCPLARADLSTHAMQCFAKRSTLDRAQGKGWESHYEGERRRWIVYSISCDECADRVSECAGWLID